VNYVRIWELHLTLRCMIRSNGFPHVLYRLWPIGMAASYLGVITERCRTQITWLWPCDMGSNEEILLRGFMIYMHVYIYICLFCEAHNICLCLAMIVYVVHVSRWCWCRWLWWSLATERGYLGSFMFLYIFMFYDCGITCKLLWDIFGLFHFFIIMDFGFII